MNDKKLVENDFFYMKVMLDKCDQCKKRMTRYTRRTIESLMNRPNFEELEKEFKEEDIVFKSKGGKWLFEERCEACQENMVMKCYNCKKTVPFEQVKISIGDEPDHLCKECYANIPAKEWDDLIDKLEDLHRWDYE